MFFEYDRVAAVEYARKWALSSNPQIKDYEQWGGNCTNYISQCINAGGIPMDSDGNNVMKEWYWYSNNKMLVQENVMCIAFLNESFHYSFQLVHHHPSLYSPNCIFLRTCLSF